MWIYEYHNWPNFTWDTEKISYKLADIRYRQGLLLGKMKGLGIPTSFSVANKDGKIYIFMVTQGELFIGVSLAESKNKFFWKKHGQNIKGIDSISSYTDKDGLHVYMAANGSLYTLAY